MIAKFNILELEIHGKLVEVIRYFGLINMKKQIEEYKKVYNLSEGDDYAFFYYKSANDKNKIDEALALSIFRWEKANGKL